MTKQINTLAFVHLRNIHRSTGAGRVAREMTEHLAATPSINLEILADPEDHRKIIPLVGDPWNNYRYRFIQRETSRQQAGWYLWDRPKARDYWPEVQIVYCTAESYVPVGKSRLVVTAHDAQIFENHAHKVDGALLKQRLKWKLLFSRLERTADLFHTVSRFSADRLSHYFPRIRSRLRVIPNAVSSRFFCPLSEAGKEAIAKRGLAGFPFVLVPGGLHFRKNAELILQAWPELHRRHRDLFLVVANHCNPFYLEQARSLCPNLVLTGFVEDEELCALYQTAAAVWFPSRYEGFGMPVLEGMASGAPVVASNASALPEIAGDAALLADPARHMDHVEALDALLKNTSTQAELRRRGRERARLFSWKSSADQLALEFAGLV